MSDLEEFLAGERLDDVALFLSHDHLDEAGKIANYGEAVEGGVVVVTPGEEGRKLFAAGTDMDAMNFAQAAMESEGEIAPDLAGGTCPDAEEGEDHPVRFVLAFAEARNEEVGGLYAEGDVVHAYAQCDCGTQYSDRWLAGER